MGCEIGTAWWNQEVKEAISAKKTAFRADLFYAYSYSFTLNYLNRTLFLNLRCNQLKTLQRNITIKYTLTINTT